MNSDNNKIVYKSTSEFLQYVKNRANQNNKNVKRKNTYNPKITKKVGSEEEFK